jgi:hypothetical protein
MTLKYDLTKKYRNREIITVCLVSWEQYKQGKRDTLEHKIGDEWIEAKPPIKDYKRYSHGLCTYHYYEKLIQNYERKVRKLCGED